jgi:hypothetical protein
MSWTRKDRVLAVLSGEIPDRVPIFECLMHDGALEHFGGAPIGVGDNDAFLHAASACLDLCHPLHPPIEPGEDVLPDGSRIVRERWTTWTVPPRRRDPAGFLALVNREIEENEAFSLSEAEVAAWRAEARRRNALSGEMVLMHVGLSLAFLPGAGTARVEEGIYLSADQPELAQRWLRAWNRAQFLRADALLTADLCPVAIIWDDLGFKDKLFCSPATLQRDFFPALREMCDLLHGKGIKVVFHCDGNVTSILPELLACGIDGFNPLEISAGMDYTEFKDLVAQASAVVSDRTPVALVGGLDAVDVLAYGSVDRVVAETRRLLRVAGAGGGLIAASASGEIDNSMPLENVLAFWETVWEEGRY